MSKGPPEAKTLRSIVGEVNRTRDHERNLRIMRALAGEQQVVSVDSWWDALERDRLEAILELVLDAMADDYESVEIILKTINEWSPDLDDGSWMARSAAPVSRPEVIRALRELTREHYAQTYILGGKEARPVKFDEDEVDDLWFYATPKGIHAVKQFLAATNP